MPAKRKAATKKADKPEHEVKKQRLSKALSAKSIAKTELPDSLPCDSEFPDKSYTVFIDQDEGIVYDVMLNQCNAGENNNKYYVIQVLHSKSNPSSFTCWTRWGRVGYPGQTSSVVSTQDNAIKEFNQKFKAKTGNSFDDFRSGSFTKKSGKYDVVEIDHSKKDSSTTTIDIKIDNDSVPSKLHPDVKAAIDMMCDMTAIERFMKSQMNYDADKAPLGKITKAQVKAGFEVLSKIEKKLLANKFDKEFENLISEYYTKIPHNFGFSRPKLIKTMDELKQELQLLETLSDIEIVNSSKKKDKDSKPMHPSDRNYERLQCELSPVPKNSDTYKLIKTYLENSQGKTHGYNMKLHNVFEINRHGESTRYSSHSKNIHNKNLLWHGSGIANWFGILSQGLRIAPPEAPVSGYMFGKGVYFADCCSKSAGYCRASTGQKCFMTLAEVALGNCRQLKNSDCNANNLPKNFHSTHGVGRNFPDEKQKRKIKLEKNEVIVPLGKIIEKDDSDGCCLWYNEFIVYDVNQIRLRYLLEVEF